MNTESRFVKYPIAMRISIELGVMVVIVSSLSHCQDSLIGAGGALLAITLLVLIAWEFGGADGEFRCFLETRRQRREWVEYMRSVGVARKYW